MSAPTEVTGWRPYALEDGRLAPSSEGVRATENLTYLLESVGASVDVLARVQIRDSVESVAASGEVPETTWRGSTAEVIEIHLAPIHEPHADALRAAYGIPVAVYDVDEWPAEVRAVDPHGVRREISEDDFRKAMSALSFGTLGKLGWYAEQGPEGQAVLDGFTLKTGRQVAETLAAGTSTKDAARVLYDMETGPSFPEAEAFVEAVIEHLYPFDSSTVQRRHVFTTPPGMFDEISRSVSLSVAQIGRALP